MSNTKKPRAKKADEPTAIVAYKGLDKNFQCRGHQFAVGETYTHKGRVEACASGFHVCTDPFDVWGYYAPGDGNRFAQVEVSGKTDAHSGDSKLAVETLRITAELSLFDFVKLGVDKILKRAKETKAETGYQSAATNTGDRSAATNTGNRSAATNTGYQSAATNTGDRSAATNTGDRSAATVEGRHSVALASGFDGRVMATQPGSVIAAVERSPSDYTTILSAAIGIVGQDGIEPGQWYVAKGGKLVVA